MHCSCSDVMLMSVKPAFRNPFSYSWNESSAGDASDVAPALPSLLRRQLIFRHNVGDADAPARTQDALHLSEHPLIHREVNDAVGHDDVDYVGELAR